MLAPLEFALIFHRARCVPRYRLDFLDQSDMLYRVNAEMVHVRCLTSTSKFTLPVFNPHRALGA